MNSLRIEQGFAKLFSENGTVLKTIGKGNMVDSDLKSDGSRILTTSREGKVELRNKSGSLIRTMGNREAVSAKFCGCYILISSRSGRKELRNPAGDLVFDLDSLSEFLKKSHIIEKDKLESKLTELPDLREKGLIDDDELDLLKFILNYSLEG